MYAFVVVFEKVCVGGKGGVPEVRAVTNIKRITKDLRCGEGSMQEPRLGIFKQSIKNSVSTLQGDASFCWLLVLLLAVGKQLSRDSLSQKKKIQMEIKVTTERKKISPQYTNTHGRCYLCVYIK